MSEVKRYDGKVSHSDEGGYVSLVDYATLKAERDALAASFDELAKAVGWSVQQCEQTGESPMDVAVSLVNLVYELENEEPTTAGKLEKLAGAMLNRSLDSGSKQAVAYAECADMVATFAANLRKENGND